MGQVSRQEEEDTADAEEGERTSKAARDSGSAKGAPWERRRHPKSSRSRGARGVAFAVRRADGRSRDTTARGFKSRDPQQPAGKGATMHAVKQRKHGSLAH